MPERVYRHYQDLEEFHAGMWRIVRGEPRIAFAKAAADLMRDPGRFRDAMAEVLAAWPVSVSVAMTAESTNRIAWLGHAGCCYALQSPEEATRHGWHMLTPSEQDAANKAAADVLEIWTTEYGAGSQYAFHFKADPC